MEERKFYWEGENQVFYCGDCGEPNIIRKPGARGPVASRCPGCRDEKYRPLSKVKKAAKPPYRPPRDLRTQEPIRPEMVYVDERERHFVRFVLGGLSKADAYERAGLNERGAQGGTLRKAALDLWESPRVEAFRKLTSMPSDDQARALLIHDLHFNDDISTRAKAAKELFGKKEKDVKSGAQIWLDVMTKIGTNIVKPCECGCEQAAKVPLSELMAESEQ